MDSRTQAFLAPLVERLRQVEGIAAMALGGSRARGVGDDDSDFDLGLYYRASRPFSIAELNQAAAELDDQHRGALMFDFGAWGPGVDGGGWLLVGGHHVDFLYRDLERLALWTGECLQGRVNIYYQLGHPTGFHNHMYMAELNCCEPLYDPSAALAELRALTTPYPLTLRDALVHKHLFDAEFELQLAAKAASRRDVFATTGLLFRSAGFLIQIVYALTRRYFINEKRALTQAASFELVPGGFRETIEQVQGEAGGEQMTAAVSRMQSLLALTRQLCQSVIRL